MLKYGVIIQRCVCFVKILFAFFLPFRQAQFAVLRLIATPSIHLTWKPLDRMFFRVAHRPADIFFFVVTPVCWFLMSLIAPGLSCQPVVNGEDLAAPAPEETHLLELRREGDVTVVLMQDLFQLMDRLFEPSSGSWDPIQGILRIEAEGQRFDLLAKRPVLLIDGRIQRMEKSVLVRQGQVMIPIDSVRTIFDALGVEIEIGEETKKTSTIEELTVGLQSEADVSSPTATTDRLTTPTTRPVPSLELNRDILFGQSTPAPVATPGVDSAPKPAVPQQVSKRPEAIPALPGDWATTPASEQITTTPGRTVETALVPNVPSEPEDRAEAASQSPLQPPPQLAGRIGLTWAQLADTAHRFPPQRITIVCDPSLEGLARTIREKLDTDWRLSVSVVRASGQGRAQDSLLADVYATGAELLVDLMALNPEKTDASDGDRALRVWAVHSALWPGDRQPGDPAEDSAQSYRRHEFQNLALGSLLRTEFSHQFPDRVVLYELAPLYLLRRVDAPTAAILIPTQGGEEQPALDDDTHERLARAVYAAVAGYIEGMRGVQF